MKFARDTMSVLACDRRGCNNVMCNRLVEERYICEECATEFREQIGEASIPIREMSKAFNAFMDGEKSVYTKNVDVTVDQCLRQDSRKTTR